MDRGDRQGLHFTSALLADGWAKDVRLEIVGGVITKIERGVAPGPDDERAEIALPGMPNLHSHAFQRGMAGLAEHRGPGADSFWTWRETMYRFVDALTPDDIEAIAALAYVEMLEAGFTRVGEFHYLHHDVSGRPYADPAEHGARIAATAQATGIGLTLLPVFYAHAGFGGAAPGAAQRRFITDPTSFARLIEASRAAIANLDDAVLGIAPHSLRAVTRDELVEIIPLARGGPIHIHAAEQIAEVEQCLAWSGQRPVEWLLDHAPIDARWCLVHATHITETESARLAASGAVAGLCPITEANLGDGIFPGAGYRGAWGIGSDSNVLIDMPEELRLLEYGQRLRDRARNLMGGDGSTGAALFQSAIDGGARALGVGAGLTVGASADFVTLDPDHPSLIGRSGDAILDSLIFAARGGMIDTVWRRGVKLVSNGIHQHRQPIAARYRATLKRLLAR